MHKHWEGPDEIVVARGNVMELFEIFEKPIDLLSQHVLLRIMINRHDPIRIWLAAGGLLEFPEYRFDCRPQSIDNEQAWIYSQRKRNAMSVFRNMLSAEDSY